MTLTYFFRRLIFMVGTLLIISVMIFTITDLLPGDAAWAILGQSATQEDLATLRAKLGLDRPAPVRYIDWMSGVAHGDLGTSLRMGVPVGPLLLERLGRSLQLALLAFGIGVPLAIGLGIVAGLWRNRAPDVAISLGTLFAVSLPEFVTGVVLILVFATWLHWLPPSSLLPPNAGAEQTLRVLILPAATLMLVMLAHTARMTRASMAEVMQTPYIRTAILKGVPMRTVVLRHALRNALLPTITIIAINIGWLIGGLVVVESVFSYPGLGRLLVDAVGNKDVPVLQSVTLLIAAIYAVANLAADLLYAYLNPRIRYS